MRAVLALLLALAAGPAAAQTSLDCDGLASALDRNFCARDGWALADAALDAVLETAAARTDAALLADQRAWLLRRDAACAAERDAQAAGPEAAMVYWQCMDRMTIWRLAQLRARL